MENARSISELKIGHRNWEEALANAFALLVSVSPGEVVCITGPSRAGKTKLVLELSKLLFGETSFDETGTMPIVVVDAVNSGPNGTFSTKAFTLRMLEAVRHPLFSNASGEAEEDVVFKKLQRTTESSLRIALEYALKIRKVRYLIIDEAQHARYASKNAQGAFAVMDSWKCLAQTVGLVLVVVGAYPILQIIRNSPHLIGRKHQVHLPRYQLNTRDMQEFAAIVAAYETQIDLCPSVGSLVKRVSYLHGGTEGCIGLLRAWLLRAQAKAGVSRQGVTMDILEQTSLSDDDLLGIGMEIREGEYLLNRSSVNRAHLEEESTSSRGVINS